MSEKDGAQSAAKTRRVHLFKDNERYNNDVFVGVNGKSYLIQRGVDVEVPEEVAEVLEHSAAQDMAASRRMDALAAAAAQALK